jgi:hypothetical protein
MSRVGVLCTVNQYTTIRLEFYTPHDTLQMMTKEQRIGTHVRKMTHDHIQRSLSMGSQRMGSSVPMMYDQKLNPARSPIKTGLHHLLWVQKRKYIVNQYKLLTREKWLGKLSSILGLRMMGSDK